MMPSRRSTIKVRRAEPRDAEAMHATFSAPQARAGTLQMPYPSVELWRKRLTDVSTTDYLLVAEIDGVVVGNLGLHAASTSPRRKHAASIGMSVHDDWRNRGVGSALMLAALDIADNWHNYLRLELTVYTDNAAALALYRKFGFATEGTLKDYAFRDGRYIDAYTMARLRSPAPATSRSSTTKSTKSTKKGPEVHRKATKTTRKQRSS
jgi:L-phenylalanine/L-methionine N-acetyltransferase